MPKTDADEAANDNPACPACGKPKSEKYRPFCSRRCADLDLGRWLDGDYVLPGDSEIPDETDDEMRTK